MVGKILESNWTKLEDNVETLLGRSLTAKEAKKLLNILHGALKEMMIHCQDTAMSIIGGNK